MPNFSCTLRIRPWWDNWVRTIFSHQILALLIDNKELIRKADSYIGIIKYLMPIAGMFSAQLSVSMFMFLLYEALVESLGTVYLAVTHILFMTFVLVRKMIAGFAEGVRF